jgi:hypothetical protein
MYYYKFEDRYDQKTGKKIGSTEVVAGVICDFTGEFFEYVEEAGTSYELQYNSIDPCCGCGIGENEFAKKYKINIHEFLLGSPYIFSDKENAEGQTVMELMLEAAKKEDFDRLYFDQLFRWARVKTADRLLSEKKYTLQELGLKDEDY